MARNKAIWIEHLVKEMVFLVINKWNSIWGIITADKQRSVNGRFLRKMYGV